mgnify:CR=1 FL=1
MKRILDTVHGYIMVSDELVKNIIDTPAFQRLRRVEQTSIRSVYPSARHDRFIHSLGVYHIGSLIVDHLRKEEEANDYWGETANNMSVIYNSYLVACLLHDVGHAPFSHTFEEYYGQKKDLARILADEVDSENFKSDLQYVRALNEPNFHEYVSAYLVHHEFGVAISRLYLDSEFIARMITGTFYVADKDNHQIHNCFISLLHGKVIDADRLDYACRDVWASGYSTSSIDLRRLISSLHIMRNGEKDYVVCFEANSLNEIEGVLNVKDFQMRYVINHHVVNHEQWLLRQAAETLALKLFRNEENGYDALGKLINIKALTGEIQILGGFLKIHNLSDDDLVFLMKQYDDNEYYKQWSSRQYNHVALWKSPDEFYHFFPGISRTKTLKHKYFEPFVKQIISNECKLEEDDILITEAKFKPRVKMNSLYIIISQDLVRYTDLYPDKNEENEDILFYYVFIPKIPKESRRDLIARKNKIINKLNSILVSMYMEKPTIITTEDN